jgi:hypothetical protein
MPSRMTQESYRPGAPIGPWLATLQPPLLTSFKDPNGAVMKANMKRLRWERSIAASSLRGLQSRSATNQNDQAAEEKKTRGRGGLDAAKTILASSSGVSVFRLTSPLQKLSSP